MFLLPSLLVGILLALVLGGRLERLVTVRFRFPGLVALALAGQVVLFSRLGEAVPESASDAIHLATYGLLAAFAVANLHLRSLAVAALGMTLNAIAILANGGRMPVAPGAAVAVGMGPDEGSNVTLGSHQLQFLGDVFALPRSLPFTNVFSVGDVLIAVGVIAFIVVVSLDDGKTRRSGMAQVARTLRNRPFRHLATAKLVSQIGDWLTTAALVGWIYHATGSTTQVAALMLARLVPPIVGSGVAAVVVDRVPRRRLLVFVEVTRGVAVLGAVGAIAAGETHAVFAAIALSGALAAVSASAMPVLVPALVPVAQYEAANACLGLTENVAMTLGAASAGIALSSIGIEPALLIDVSTFAVAALLYGRLSLPASRSARRRPRGVLVGLRYLLHRRSMLVLVGSFAVATLATGLANATLPRFLETGFGLGESGYGFAFAALAAGLALGEGSVGFVRVGRNAGRWIAGGLAIMSGLFVLLALVEHTPTALLVLMAIGFVDGTTDVVFDTAVQREADCRYHGAIFGFASACFRTTMMTAAAVAPIVNGLLPASDVLLGTAFCLAAGSAVALAGIVGLGPLRLPRPAGARS